MSPAATAAVVVLCVIGYLIVGYLLVGVAVSAVASRRRHHAGSLLDVPPRANVARSQPTGGVSPLAVPVAAGDASPQWTADLEACELPAEVSEADLEFTGQAFRQLTNVALGTVITKLLLLAKKKGGMT